MHRSSLVSDVAVFPTDGRASVLLDRCELTFWVRRRTAVPRHGPLTLRSTADFGLIHDVALRHRRTRDGWIIRWTHAAVSFEFLVPTHPTRGMYSVRMMTVFNPLRMLRAKLSRRERALHRAPPDAKDNMLDPRAVPPEVAHQRVVKLVPRIVRRLRGQFIAIMRCLFAVDLIESEVSLTASQIELAWDRACDSSHTAIHAFTPAWLGTIPRARKRFRFGREEDDPHVELLGEGVLKASFRKGWVLKMYGLPGGALRFECLLTAKAGRSILGEQMQLTSRRALDEHLARLADRVYGPIVEVQQSLSPSDVPSAEQLLTALVPTASESLALHIAEQLVAFGRVRCNRDTPSVYKAMCRMRARGLMEKSSQPGHWGPTPSFALLVQSVMRQCLVLSGVAHAR